MYTNEVIFYKENNEKWSCLDKLDLKFLYCLECIGFNKNAKDIIKEQREWEDKSIFLKKCCEIKSNISIEDLANEINDKWDFIIENKISEYSLINKLNKN